MTKYRIVKSIIGFSVSEWHERIVKPTLIQKYFFDKKVEIVGRWQLIDKLGLAYSISSVFPPAIFDTIEEAEGFVERLKCKIEVVKEYDFES